MFEIHYLGTLGTVWTYCLNTLFTVHCLSTPFAIHYWIHCLQHIVQIHCLQYTACNTLFEYTSLITLFVIHCLNTVFNTLCVNTLFAVHCLKYTVRNTLCDYTVWIRSFQHTLCNTLFEYTLCDTLSNTVLEDTVGNSLFECTVYNTRLNTLFERIEWLHAHCQNFLAFKEYKFKNSVYSTVFTNVEEFVLMQNIVCSLKNIFFEWYSILVLSQTPGSFLEFDCMCLVTSAVAPQLILQHHWSCCTSWCNRIG